MARRPTPEFAALNVQVPRGHAGFWKIIRTLDGSGPWSVADVAGQTNVQTRTISDYVRRLVRASIAIKAGEYKGPVGLLPRYRLVQRPLEAPRLRRDGSASLPTAQEQMWTAIRVLGCFTYVELAHAASTDVVAVSPTAAKDYLNRLGRAGYLAAAQPGTAGKPTLWRLKPSMNTGPLPPMVMRTKFIWDQNRGEVVGAAAAEVHP